MKTIKFKYCFIAIALSFFALQIKSQNTGSKAMPVEPTYSAEELARIQRQREETARRLKEKQAEIDRKTQEDYNRAEEEQKQRQKKYEEEHKVGTYKFDSNNKSKNSTNNSHGNVQYYDPIQSTQDAYNKGVNELTNTIMQIMRNKAEAERVQREQEKRDRLQAEEEKRQREQEEIDEANRRAEIERIERERVEIKRRNLTNSRLNIISSFTEANIPTSGSNTNSNKLFYFVYSYNQNNLAEQGMTISVSAPFEIDKRSDGTWPYKNDILNEIRSIIPTPVVFHGFYNTLEEATLNQQLFVNNITQTGAVVNTFNYKGKKSNRTNTGTDYWGKPVSKTNITATTKISSNTTSKPKEVKKTDSDFWGAPVKK